MIERLLKYFGYIKQSRVNNYCVNCNCFGCSMTKMWMKTALNYLEKSIELTEIDNIHNQRVDGSKLVFNKIPLTKKEHKRCQKKRKM